MPKALVILGPTAIGKSSLAEKIAHNFKLPIISADSRQLFKELYIGVAKPKEATLNTIQHFEIGSISIHDKNDVAQYCERVKKHLKQITGDLIIVGGTGFYIKALLEGIEELPPKNIALRSKLEKENKKTGIKSLQDRYNSILNPYPVKDMNNPHRLIRAIEMGEKTALKKIPSILNNYEVHIIGLEMSRESLYERINHRVNEMMVEGQLEEAKKLIHFQHLQALQTVGYSELFRHFKGELSLPDAVEKIKQHTRNYAKRQMTYFKHQLNVNWFDAKETEKINTFVSNILS